MTMVTSLGFSNFGVGRDGRALALVFDLPLGGSENEVSLKGSDSSRDVSEDVAEEAKNEENGTDEDEGVSAMVVVEMKSKTMIPRDHRALRVRICSRHARVLSHRRSPLYAFVRRECDHHGRF